MIEHRLIERMVEAIKKEGKRLEGGGAVDVPFMCSAVDFFRVFADRCHHGKEEEILFAKLSTKPMTKPLKEMMEQLKADHVRARHLIREVAGEALRSDHAPSSSKIAMVMAEINDLYPRHIEMEDKHFFPATMQYLDAGEREEMLKAFEDLEKELLHEKYHAVIEEAEKR